MEWLSLLLPFSYLAILLLSLGTFSHLYRRRKALRSASLEPWFPPHLTRQIYLTLLEQAASPAPSTNTTDSEKQTTPKIPDSLLRAALMRRATTDIHRLISLRSQKPALQQLLQRGAVGDELFQRFERAEKEMESELRDVVAEANALSAPGVSWGQTIFQSAGEAAHAEILRGKLEAVESGRGAEREGWERRRGEMREGFLKGLELDDGRAPAAGNVGGDGAKKEPVKKQGSSDDDAVLVEADGHGSRPSSRAGLVPPQLQRGASPVGGSAKKKKGKK